MALNPITGGLHRLTHDSAQATKVELTIPPGDELEVSDDVAAQLHAASTHFRDPADVPAPSRQVVKDADGVPAGWSDGTQFTAKDVDVLGFAEHVDAPIPVEVDPVPRRVRAPRKAV